LAICLITAITSVWLNTNIAQSADDQATWQQVDHRADLSRAGLSMVYDSNRQVAVLFGERISSFTTSLDETLEYDGTAWSKKVTATAPSPRFWHAMAYDSNRQRVILYGGQDDEDTFNDTWEYDGDDWVQISTDHSPPSRAPFSMVYDSTRSRILLFDGTDIWEYNASDWIKLVTVTSPPLSSDSAGYTAMTYDSARDKVVLFNFHVGGTWEFDGSDWAQVNTTTSPPTRWHHCMVFDSLRNRVVMYGGYNLPTESRLDDTWEFDGTDWSLIPIDSPTPRLEQHGMVFDEARSRIVMFGGFSGSGKTWEYTITLDGEEEEWEYPEITAVDVDTEWELVSTQTNVGRNAMGIAYDSDRHVVVVFGGMPSPSGNILNDTWEYSGGSWNVITTEHSPPARFSHAMAYDSNRQRIVVFGGSDRGVNFNDTWEYDGSNWQQVNTANSPAPRRRVSMVFNSVSNRMVLFGGQDASGDFNDTWEYNGTDWILVDTEDSPPRGVQAAMAFDSKRNKVVFYGSGIVAEGPSDAGTWEWPAPQKLVQVKC